MSYAELLEWQVWSQDNPISNPWLQTGLICATLANVWRSEKTKAYDPEDFMPVVRKPKPEKSIDELMILWSAVAVKKSK